MKIYIFATGTEISSGKSLDTNSKFIAESLTDLGFQIQSISAYPDDPNLIKNEIVKIASNPEKSILIITGGLGATSDDHTLSIVKELIGSKTIQVKYAYDKLISSSKRRGQEYIDLLPITSKQTYVPEDAEVLHNEIGIAPGFFVKIRPNFYLSAMPGVPREMKPMFQNYLLPILLNHLNTKKFYFSKTIWNTSEALYQSQFIEKNQEVLSNHKITWGVTAKPGRIKVSFISEYQNLEKTMYPLLDETYGENITNDIQEELHNYFLRSNLKISSAESCTSGLIGKLITDTPGSSAYYLGSIIAYDNSIKIKLLNVKTSTLEKFGAVSEEVAIEMLNGLEEVMDSDCSIATTGIAGPTGGSDKKPLGLVYIGIKLKGKEPKVYKNVYPFGRDTFRETVSTMSLFYLFKEIKNRI
jgi:nicotinamide-nucleotide amidase